MSDASRLSGGPLPRHVTAETEAGATGEVGDACLETRQEELHADNYVTGGGLTQPPLALAGQPPVPDAPAARGASLSSAGQALATQAQRIRAGSPSSSTQLAEQSAEIASGAIAAAINRAYASMGRSSAEDEARHQRTESADIAKAVRAGYRHIDQEHTMRESGDRLQRAGITEGSNNPAVRLAQLHRGSQPGWSGDASDAVGDTLEAASNAACQGLPAFAVGRRDLQG